jgi:hypothetical protein
MARLSMWLTVLVVAVLLFSSSARAAAPISPKLLSTTPTSIEASPALSTTPLVLGEAEPEDGIIIQGTQPSPFGTPGLTTAAVKTPTQHPEYEILVYAQADCAGAEIGRGLAGAFEESGIPVVVPANALTVLSAAQVDSANPTKTSACSGPLLYWEGAVPGGGGEAGGDGGGTGGNGGGGSAPGASEGVGPAVTAGKPQPPSLHISPKAVANYNAPAIAGSAPGAASVVVYANGTCSGAALAKGPAAQLSSGFPVQVADNTTTTFSAVAVGGKRSDCSAPVSYIEDSTAPVTRVTMGPGVKTRKRKVVFRFADVVADSPGTSFFCKVDKARWKRCASPLRLNHLRLSRHMVRVRAVDLAGNAERLGAKRIFTVVPAS